MELNDISLAKLQDFVQLQEETSHLLVLDQFIDIFTCHGYLCKINKLKSKHHQIRHK